MDTSMLQSYGHSPNLHYSDEAFANLVKNKFLQDARRDAVLDVFIYKCYLIQVAIDPSRALTVAHARDRYSSDYFISRSNMNRLEEPQYNEPQQELAAAFNASSFYELWPQIKDEVETRQKAVLYSVALSQGKQYGDQFAKAVNKSMMKDLVAEAGEPYKKKGARSLVQEANKAVFRSLCEAVEDEKAGATFCVGGEIDDKTATVAFQQNDTPDGLLKRIDFPVNDSNLEAVQTLAQACDPASFGFNGENVLDENYRRALKLDNTKFVTNFHPYDVGILDLVQKMLLPRSSARYQTQIVAELYKLNIYAGPSGMFKAHVDTPRSESQIGSLVVCLPCAHDGGQLMVRHNGRTQCFDWSQGNPTAIKWAAFYSDVEHEVLQVKSGYRCTLTYNIYSGPSRSEVIPLAPTLNITSLPLFSELSTVLSSPNILPNGGVIGFYCDHRYPHTDKHGYENFPQALKGVDAAIFSVLQHLDIPVETRPFYDLADLTGENDDWSFENSQAEDLLEEFKTKGYAQRRSYAQPNNEPFLTELPLEYRDNAFVIIEEAFQSVEKRLESLLAGREIVGWSRPRVTEYYIGKQFEKFKTFDYEASTTDMVTALNLTRLWDGVHWINKPHEENNELAVAYVTYGNEAGLGTTYSRAVILATIPPYSDTRGKTKGKQARE